MCELHKCYYGSVINELGLHPLFCSQSVGVFHQHNIGNSVIISGLNAAGFLSQLEPLGFDNKGSKCSDSITLFPYEDGEERIKPAWDVLYSDTFSRSNLTALAGNPSITVYSAEEKQDPGRQLCLFVLVATEPSVVLRLCTADFST